MFSQEKKKCNEKFKNNFLREIRGSRIYSSNQQVEINQAKKKHIFNNFHLKKYSIRFQRETKTQA